MLRQPPGFAFVAAPAPRLPTLWLCVSFISLAEIRWKAYNPPTAPPRNANPLARARYFKGKTSDGIAWTIEIVERVHPTRMPPPMSIFIEVALAEMTAPMKERTGGPIARYFLSRTSERRPTMGESTLCIKSGPFCCQFWTRDAWYWQTWIIHPAIGASPISLIMKPITDPAATTTKTWAMMAKQVTLQTN